MDLISWGKWYRNRDDDCETAAADEDSSSEFRMLSNIGFNCANMYSAIESSCKIIKAEISNTEIVKLNLEIEIYSIEFII